MFKRTVSGIILTILLTSMLTLAFNIQPAKATGTIYIRADGSIDPPDASISTSDNVTYILTDNISSDNGIMVEKSSIIIDGCGFALRSVDLPIELRGTAIDCYCINNVTIEDIDIDGWGRGIYLSYNSFNNNVSANKIANNTEGIVIGESSNYNSILGNVISNNEYGMVIFNSSFNGIFENNITDNKYRGITLDSSNYNSICRNIIIGCGYDGIWLRGSSSYNAISGNNISAADVYGIELYDDEQPRRLFNNSISGNNLAADCAGIELEMASNSSIFENNITTNTLGKGIALCDSSDNSIFENNISNNSYAVSYSFEKSEPSNNNRIFHNNFLNNTNQVDLIEYLNAWDDGYPSGGNYWSDYNGTDRYSGVNQDELGNDGIGDTPFSIDENNTDSYPLIVPWGTAYSSYDWPMFHHDPLHTGFTKDSLSLPLHLKWNTTLSDLGYSSPVVIGDYLYIGGEDIFYALNASNGEILWNEAMADWVAGSPAVSGGLVYVGSDKIYAFDALNGSLVWSYAGGSSISCSPAVAYGNVYATAGSTVLALRADTGKLVWSYEAGDVFYVNSPAVSNGVVYIGSFDYNVCALDAFNGSVLWKSPTPGFIDCSPSINDGIVYVAGHIDGNSGWNGPGILYAFKASDGTQLWNRTFGRVSAGTPAVVSGVVYVGSEDENFYALNGSNGEIIWRKDFSASMAYSSPAFVNNMLFVAVNTLHTLYAVNATDGEILWNCTARDLIDDSPAVAGKTLYFGACDATVYAYESNSTFHAIPGDLNGDGEVDIYDAILLSNAYNSSPSSPNWDIKADINSDNIVDLYDAIILAGNFGKTG